MPRSEGDFLPKLFNMAKRSVQSIRRAAGKFNQTLEPTGMSAADLPLRRQIVVYRRLPVAQLFGPESCGPREMTL